MKLHGWSGNWPTDEYPKKGTPIKYETVRDGKKIIKAGQVDMVWCGVEPAFRMDNGDYVFPTLDKYEVLI